MLISTIVRPIQTRPGRCKNNFLFSIWENILAQPVHTDIHEYIFVIHPYTETHHQHMLNIVKKTIASGSSMNAVFFPYTRACTCMLANEANELKLTGMSHRLVGDYNLFLT